MNDTEGRRALWEALGTVEDWLEGPASRVEGWGGARRARVVPDFKLVGVPREASSPVSGKAEGAGDPAASLAAMAGEVAACRKCRLAEDRNTSVFGEGVPRPLVLVVGEGPGEEEDREGRPFVGPAGRLLDKMLGSIGLSRDENCYIANVVKCRPPENRDPAPDEREACLSYLEGQIAALRPAVILALGRVAVQSLLDTTEGITRLRGRWFHRGDLPLIATYHPSALLRDESLKRPAWEDLKMLRERLSALGPSAAERN